MNQTPTNKERLEAAGLIEVDWQYSPSDLAVIDSLTEQEVQSIIDLSERLGLDFLHRNSPHGVLF